MGQRKSWQEITIGRTTGYVRRATGRTTGYVRRATGRVMVNDWAIRKNCKIKIHILY